MNFCILKIGDSKTHIKWVKSCSNIGVNYKVINLFSNNWIEKIKSRSFDCFLLRTPGNLEKEKNLFDQRIYILSHVLNKKTYPKYNEVVIHENKKMLRDYLIALDIPHPKTAIFFDKSNAIKYIKNHSFPIVGKTSIGASGSGVKILENYKQAYDYIKHAFSFRGIKTRIGPNPHTGGPRKWFLKSINNPLLLKNKLLRYYKKWKNRQRGYVILQQHIPHSFEWRAVKIGKSYFAHKKIKKGNKASGTKGIDYVTPPFDLLDFVRKWSDKLRFNSMAFDIFEHRGEYLVNELQPLFGHVQNHIMEVNNKKGRYLFRNNSWQFEEGDFNTNESYDLRLKHAIELLENGEL